MFYQPGSLSMLTILLATTATTVPILVLGGVGVVAQSASNEQSEFPLLKDLPQGTQVRINGSSSMMRMNQALGQKFQSQYPQTSVVTSYDGTDAGLQAVLDGKADLAGMGRVLADGEKAKGLNGTAVSRHKIAVFVGKDNPFNQSLTINQFAQIFRGQVTDWSKLGGKAGNIRLIDRPENSDTRTAFASYPVFKSAPLEAGKNAVKLSEDSTDAVVAALGQDGIGYAIADQVVNNPNVRILAMHKVLPTDPRYPFSQPLLYAYKGDKPNLPAQAFLGLATAPATQAVVEQARLETAKSADSQTAVNPPATIPGTTATVTNPPATSPDAAATVTNPPATGTDNAATVTNPPTGASTDDNVTSVQPASPDQVANAPAGSTTAESQTKFPWWLLLIPVLGGMLWWLLKNLNGASPVAVAPVAAAAGAVAGKNRESRIVLTPRDARNGYAYWEISPTVEDELRRQGKRGMKLRLYDVTDIDMDLQTPHSVQEFDCRPGERDLHLPIPMDNREYVAEIGYPESNGSWSRIARSQPVGFSSPTPASSISRTDNGVDTPTPTSADTSGDDQAAAASLWGDSPRVNDRGDNGVNGNTDISGNNTEDNPNLGAGIAGVAAAGAGATLVNLFSQNKNRVAPPDPTAKANKIDTKLQGPRSVMVPRTPENAYVYWELPPEYQAQDKLMLRLYDATGVDNFDTSTALPFSTYDCTGQNDLHVRIPESERDYVGELGYENPDGTWVKLTQTEKVRVPAAIPTDQEPEKSAAETTPSSNNPVSATVAAVTNAASNGVNTVSQNVANVADTAKQTTTGWMSGVSQSMGNAIAGGTAAVAGVGSAANALWNQQNNEQPDISTPRQRKNPCQIILVPLNSQQAYAYWEISDEHKQAARSQGGSRFMLRVHDSTNLDIDYQQPHQTQEYPCNEQEYDRHVTIPHSDRDYIAEVGYYTNDNRWIRIIRSFHVHVG